MTTVTRVTTDPPEQWEDAAPRRARTAVLVAVLTALASSAAAQATAEKSAPTATEREAWDIIYMQGGRVGYTHSVEREIERDGQKLIAVDNQTKLVAKRFGEALEQTMVFSSLETPQGELREFSTTLQMGAAPVVTRGVVDGQTLRLETVANDKLQTAEAPWKPGTLGFNALESSLRRDPLEPGERREFEALMPVFNQIATTTLQAKQKEPVKLLDGTRELLRVDCRTSVGGLNLDSTIWVDDAGEPLKSESPLLAQVTYRSTREEALKPVEAPAGDLALSTLVHVADMPKNLRTAERVEYRVRLKSADPARSFAQLGWQQVEPIDDRAAKVVVERCGPQRLPSAAAPEADRPTDDDRQPNSLIESDDPLVRLLAAEGVGSARTPAEKAIALEKFVHDKIEKKDFSTVFASAAEVAKTCEGDCTEHGVLLAALLRANDIPARTVVGLVYVRGLKAFGYHMWTEAWLDDRWAPLDATLGHGGTGIGHVAIATSSLAGASPYAVFLPVAQLLGQLEMEVVEEEGDRP